MPQASPSHPDKGLPQERPGGEEGNWQVHMTPKSIRFPVEIASVVAQDCASSVWTRALPWADGGVLEGCETRQRR